MATVGIKRELLPSEYAIKSLGIYRHQAFFVGRPRNPALDVLSRILPDPRVWWRKTVQIVQSLPIVLLVLRDLSKLGGHAFWIVSVGKIVQGVLPAIGELYFGNALMELAQSAATGRPVTGSHLAGLLAGQAGILLISYMITNLTTRSEEIVNERFISHLRLELLRIHCTLDEETLEAPSVQAKLALLEDITDARYGDYFEPLRHLGIIKTCVGLVTECTLLGGRVTRENAFVVGVTAAVIVLQELDFAGNSGPTAMTLVNDSWLRFISFMSVGTMSSYRREVVMLGIGEHILEQATANREAVGDLRTSWREEDGFDPRHVIERMTSSIVFALYAWQASRAILASRPVNVSFANLTSLNAAVSRINSGLVSLRWGVERAGYDLDAMEAYYFCRRLEHPARADVATYASQSRVEDAAVSRGMQIEFRNVTVKYPGSLVAALDDVSFTILPGELVSIIGPSGSGKTTLISLLSMNQKVTSGQILVNGKDIYFYSKKDLSRVVSFTFQTSTPLPFTIRDYVSLGSIEHRHDSNLVRKALVDAGAAEFVDKLKDGVDSFPGGVSGNSLSSSFSLPQVVPRPPEIPTIELEAPGSTPDSDDEKPSDSSKPDAELRRSLSVDVDGKKHIIRYSEHSPKPSTLSGGQWQRIALAQSLMKPTTDLLVWDEPSASLDPISEAALFNVILGKKGQSTVIFTTHRYNVTPKADKLLFFAEGKLVEEGSHAELMKLEKGQYREMWELQAEGYQQA